MELFGAQAEWGRQLRDYAVEVILPFKNENWPDEDLPPVTAEQLEAAMKLLSISVSPDGDFSFFHQDGGLFGEHSIDILGTLEGGLESLGLAG